MAFMSSHAHFFALLEVENLSKQFADVLRKGTEHPRRRRRRADPRRASPTARIRDEDPILLALGVRRRRRLLRPLPPHRPHPPVGRGAGRFVGRFVVCSLAADETIARRVLAVAPSSTFA